jgi:hypothetical protein
VNIMTNADHRYITSCLAQLLLAVGDGARYWTSVSRCRASTKMAARAMIISGM